MNQEIIQPSLNGLFQMIAEIKFVCGHCGQKIAVDSDAAGLGIECPTCQNSVTIPRSGIASEPRIAEGERLTGIQAECERLRANATHAQAEIKSFQNERLSLRNEVAALKQRASAAEAQLAEVELLRQRLEATETQLASMEQERAGLLAAASLVTGERDSALLELEGVRSELAAAMAASERAQSAATEMQARFTDTETALASAQADLAGLQARFAAASGEAESLRGLMDRDEATRELLSMRTKLAGAEEELHMRRQTATQLEIDLLKAEADRDRLDAERGALHRQMADVMKRAEDLSRDRLNVDNAKLRELLDRQNEELKLRFKELTRFRRAKLTLKIIWALAILGAIGLGFLFVKILPMIEWSR